LTRNKNNDDAVRIAGSFRRVLNSHGLGFQYAALREAQKAASQGLSPWSFLAHEFPVRVHSHDTRHDTCIDFILRNHRKPVWIVAECKRSNPSLSDWCFAKVPENLVQPRRRGVFVEAVVQTKVEGTKSSVREVSGP
jgi:hypothetical protein